MEVNSSGTWLRQYIAYENYSKVDVFEISVIICGNKNAFSKKETNLILLPFPSSSTIGSGGRANRKYKVRSEWKENQFYNKRHGTQKYWSSEGNLNCITVSLKVLPF